MNNCQWRISHYALEILDKKLILCFLIASATDGRPKLIGNRLQFL